MFGAPDVYERIPNSANPVYTPPLSAVKRAVRPSRTGASGKRSASLLPPLTRTTS